MGAPVLTGAATVNGPMFDNQMVIEHASVPKAALVAPQFFHRRPEGFWFATSQTNPEDGQIARIYAVRVRSKLAADAERPLSINPGSVL
jgi:hypothetical protein